MNKIWTICVIAALALLIAVAPEQFPGVLAKSATQSVELIISLCGIYCVWLGLINIASECGLLSKLSRLIKPLCTPLLGELDGETQDLVSTALCANLIGIGNAATPSAVKAIAKMDKGSIAATKAMVMLFVINATSLQLIPTTVIGLRAASGSVDASNIVFPVIITTLLTTFIGVVLVKIFVKDKKEA